MVVREHRLNKKLRVKIIIYRGKLCGYIGYIIVIKNHNRHTARAHVKTYMLKTCMLKNTYQILIFFFLQHIVLNCSTVFVNDLLVYSLLNLDKGGQKYCKQIFSS